MDGAQERPSNSICLLRRSENGVRRSVCRRSEQRCSANRSVCGKRRSAGLHSNGRGRNARTSRPRAKQSPHLAPFARAKGALRGRNDRPTPPTVERRILKVERTEAIVEERTITVEGRVRRRRKRNGSNSLTRRNASPGLRSEGHRVQPRPPEGDARERVTREREESGSPPVPVSPSANPLDETRFSSKLRPPNVESRNLEREEASRVAGHPAQGQAREARPAPSQRHAGRDRPQGRHPAAHRELSLPCA